jgi:hypothetical protein
VPVGVRANEQGLAFASAAPSLATPPPFADPGAVTFPSSGFAFAPNAGARVAELRGEDSTNAVSSIGLLRDAVDPQSAASARDYIAAYTHPLPAGTFNRPYVCSGVESLVQVVERCSYDAPDLPAGGARFERVFTVAKRDHLLRVDLHYAPQDVTSQSRLESISGFAFEPGDTLVQTSGAIGVLHGTRLAILHWHPDDVTRVEVRQTRGAELVTLVFSGRTASLTLQVPSAPDVTEARRLVEANQP